MSRVTRRAGTAFILLLLSVIAVTPASASADPLAGAWALDEGSGDIAADVSGAADDGTIGSGVDWVTGAFGTALSFDGVSGGVDVPDAPPLEPPIAVTVAAWVDHSGTPGQWRYIVSKGATGCVAASYALYSGVDGGLEFYVSDGRGSQYTLSPDAGQGVWNGAWQFVVGTYDGTTVRLYVDGAQVGAGTPHAQSLSYNLVDSNDLTIGDYPGCVEHTFDGWIRQVSVWNVALDDAEIDALMAQTAPASTPASGTGGATGSGGDSGAGGASPAGGTPTASTPSSPVSTTPAETPAGSSPSTGSSGVSGSADGSSGSGGPGSGTAEGATLSDLTLDPGSIRLVAGRTPAGRSVWLRYRDSRAGRTTVTVSFSAAGSVIAGSCRPHTGARRGAAVRSRSGRACRTWVQVAQLSHQDRAGINRFAVPLARLTGSRDRPGHYLLVARPTGVGGLAAGRSLHFTVAPPA